MVNHKELNRWEELESKSDSLKQGVQHYDDALKENPDDFEMWWTKVTILHNNDEIDEALKVIDEIFRVSSDYINQVLERLWEIEEIALQVIDKVLEVKPQSIKALSEKASYLSNEEMYDEAVKVIGQALIVEPDNINLLRSKAQYLSYGLGYDEIRKIADDVLKRPFQDIDSLKDKAIILKYAEKYDEAVEVIDQALMIEPNDSELLDEKLNFLDLAERYDDKAKFIEILLDKDAIDVDFWLQHSTELRGLKNSYLEQKAFSRFYNKGIKSFIIDDFEQAFSHFNCASKVNPKDVDVVIKKGDSKFKRENYGQARIQYDAAIKLDPGNAEAWYKKGMALKERGEAKEAKEYIDKALSIDPNFSPNFDYKTLSSQDSTQFSPLKNLLETKKQIILYGPPGTGKTFSTKGLAIELIYNGSK